MRVCLVSRELYPYVGGGIAPIVSAAARQLSAIAEVVVVTSADHAAEHRRLRAAGDPRLLPDDVELLFVPEPGPGGFGGFYNYMHAYSARVHEVLRARYGDRGPDILEFCDYLAEGFVSIQARHTQAAWLRDTLVCVRLHTTSELCAVLDGHVPGDFVTETLFEAERYCLRHADRLLWSGGDVLETYRRYYGADRLAPGVELPDAFLDESGGVAAQLSGGPVAGEPVRLLYLGRAERRKGIHDLVRAVLDTGRDDVSLTVVGGDTDTGPLGTSLAEQLRLTAAEDPRIVFADSVPRSEVGRLLREHDALVVPSRWECWPNVAREALQHNRPLLGTPVGGLTALVRPGASGWLARGTGREALREAIEALLDDPSEITELIAAGGPRAVFEELTSVDALRRRYAALAEEAPREPVAVHAAAAADGRPPLVSIVIPYYKLDEHLDATLDSVAAQTYAAIETIVVNDGSLRPEDEAVLRRAAARPGVTVVTQGNAGLGAARNFGIAQAAGRYVLPLDADDVILPELVERLVDVLERDAALVYAGTWVQYMDEDGVDFGDDLGGYMPYGNWSTAIRDGNVGGVCTVLFRRAVFDAGFAYDDELTSYEDWLLFWQLHDAGLHGAIVPERLFRYRVRGTSMMREVGSPALDRLHGELRARRLETGTRWARDGAASEPPASPSAAGAALAGAGASAPDALAALRAANAQLAAGHLGSRGAAAAAQLRRAEALTRRVAELEAQLAAVQAEQRIEVAG